MAKRTLKEYYNEKRVDWYGHDDIDFESAKEQHRENVKSIKNAMNWRERKDRPVTIAVFHGSGRDPIESCAHEISSTKMLYQRGMELAKEELDDDPTIWEFDLRAMILDPCNGCVSTASSLCNFPCSCFPGDDITTKIYPAVIAADILFWTTPVNQSGVSTRTKTVIDRLISVDGGYHFKELPVKDDEFRSKMIKLSQDQPVYDQRMHGKVAGYFVTSKDIYNKHSETPKYPKEFRKLDYIDTTVGMMVMQGTEYGWYHADPFYVVVGADADVEYSLDKDHYDRDGLSHEVAKNVILSAIKLAKKFREEPPEFKGGGRINRT